MTESSAFCAQPAALPEPVVDAVKIELTGDPEDAQQLSGIARGIIAVKAGKPLSDQRLSRSIESLKRSGLFAAVDIPDPDWTADPMEVVFRLTPRERIQNIRIKGGFPLLEREIRNAMTIAEGDPCVPEDLPDQESRVESLFAREGYIRPKASVSVEKDPDSNHCILDLTIDKGPFYHVEAVRFDGNQAFSSARLKMRLSTWQSSLLLGGPSRFVDDKLRDDIKALKQFYHGKGFAEAEIDAEVKKKQKNGNVRVRFTIHEGPLYEVSFKGHQAFWNMTLKKDLVLFTEGNKNGMGLRKSVRNIKKRYRARGYPEVQIRTEENQIRQTQPPVKPIVFEITEGPFHMVDSVSVSGNRQFSDQRIQNQMLTALPGLLYSGAYSEDVLREDLRAIIALYTEAGYRNAQIDYSADTRKAPDKPDTILVSVKIKIDEGPATMVKRVKVEDRGLIGSDRAVDLLEMKPGTPFRQYLVKEDQTALAEAVSEQGYPHVTVEPKISINEDKTGADIAYTIDPGPATKMGETFFAGDFHTRRRILAREMTISQGEPFSLSDLLASQRNIRSLNAVDTARFKTFGLEEKAEQIHMIAEIQEVKPYFAELALGYDTRRQFYTNAAAGNRNLLGLNKILRAELELSQIGYRADLDLTEPRFFGTRISAGASLYTEETEEFNKDFGTRMYGASLGFSKALTPNLNAGLNFRYESREQYRTDDQPIPEDETEEYRSRSIVTASPNLLYNTTDSFLRPTRGVRISASVDASRGIDNDLDNFFKYRLDARWYYSPANRLTLAVHGRMGHIDPYGDNDRVPEDQLFFLGGTADVRGFSENKLRIDENSDPVGGRTAILGSAEARLALGLNLEAAVFFDTGVVQNPLSDAGDDDFRSSAGLGLRYITPIGPVGAMYGWKLDRREGESPGAFHFAIGYTF
ncbi:outer membrane protein insertion porin family [Desulfosalsimonas propionicica]|uniref:Outer membrane protein assembly factor BamA n=1 Tax=Desulfosalsimonas propionicica TaxID=332175 RepID=A0A7W0C6L8_9BACT|nr:outer membrane protein assembly factor BamA [Desulfosalsimonas propionicica]MBA2880154.1 outer membrane protein insertion porin family [Desulfosalsimonas propionicica]